LYRARVGTREYFNVLRQDAHSKAQEAYAKGDIGTYRHWLHKARGQTELLKLMARNEAFELERGQIGS